MKTTLFTAMVLLLAAATRGEVPKPDASKPNIQIDVQMVALPRAAATPLTGELLSEKTAEASWAKVQKMLAEGQAHLIGWPIVLTRDGERAYIEGIDEIRYATEYDAGGVDIFLREKGRVVEQVPSPLRGINLNPVATSFETRNAGATLEVEPTLSADGQTISLDLVPQHVSLKGMRKSVIERSSGAGQDAVERVVAEQPDFATMKVQTQLTIRNGGRVLLGVFPTDQPAGHLVLFLLHAETRAP